MAFWQTHSAHTFRHSTHRASIGAGKAHGLAFRAQQHHIAVVINNCGADQMIAFNQIHCTQTNTAWARVLLQ